MFYFFLRAQSWGGRGSWDVRSSRGGLGGLSLNSEVSERYYDDDAYDDNDN